MGAYLSEPIVEKLSSDELNEYLQVGSSSMQGWRISQEDAHNCILKYDENTSLFAVYDGHGGAEVATYCADKLPDFIKNLKSYQNKDFDTALKEAFIQFDSTLLDEKVVDILKRLAGDRNPEYDSDLMDEDDEEDLDELCQEGTLPLEKVLAKYKAKGPQQQTTGIGKVMAGLPLLNKLKKDDAAGTSKPLSPCLRGRRNIHINKIIGTNVDGSSSKCTTTLNINNETIDNDIEKNLLDDGVVSSSASVTKSPNKIESKDDNKSNEADASNETIGNNKLQSETILTKEISNSPDSSAETRDNIQNGNIKLTEPSGVSSSSSSTSGISTISPVKEKLENGEISSPSSSLVKSNQIPGKSPMKLLRKSPIKSRIESISSGISSSIDSADGNAGDDSTSDSDVEFQPDIDDSETDDGEEDCEPIDDVEDTDDEEEVDDDDEDDDEEEDMDEDAYKDEQFCANMIEEPGKDSGCTAVVALLHGRDLYVANAGDSRCVVCRDGKAIDMSIDHKPEDEEESSRISKAGGRVTLDGRVNGGLNLSRAIGDHAYKANSELKPEEQMISAMPDIKKLILDPKDEFMILACDGIWNYMSSEEVVDFVKERIDDGFNKMSKICEELFEMCLAPNTLGDGTGCDNMTAVIIRFKPQILELSTKLNPNETITIEQQQKQQKIILTTEPTSDNCGGGGAADNDKERKCVKRSASPVSIENSCSSNSNNTTEATTTSSTSNNLDIIEPCQKRLKTDDSSVASTVVDGNIEKIECSSSNSNSCSSNGTAEAESAAASITITNDIGSSTET